MSSNETDASLILVVDDNEIGRYSKVHVLGKAGFEVLETTTGAEALRLVRERRPRIVLLDVRLPDMSGWDVCRILKTDPSTSSVLVLQMSATFVGELDKVRALEGGADGCLTEPFEPTVLLATVRALLRARRAEDALRETLAREQELRGEAEAANRAKDEFLATLSHELRSPLGAILTWASLLKSGRLDADHGRRAVDAIERNARLQVRMIADLLDVSRIITGKMRLEVTRLDPTAVVEAAVDGVRATAEEKGVVLESLLTPTIATVWADPARLQQVFWNLLSNAVKFTPKGGRVEIHARRADDRVQFEVIDSGAGIAAELLPHVFERFRQADSSTTRSEGGLGIGLAIVRHFVELHGGSVEAMSDGPGRGARFVVRLPIAERAESGAVDLPDLPRVRVASGALPDLGGLRILVVDDEPDAREAIAIVLDQCGAAVTAVGSVRDALAVFSDDAFDVVVSDIAMPHEDGFRLIDQLRARSRVPALALTAYGGEDDTRRITSAGFQEHLTKPVTASELAEAVIAVRDRR